MPDAAKPPPTGRLSPPLPSRRADESTTALFAPSSSLGDRASGAPPHGRVHVDVPRGPPLVLIELGSSRLSSPATPCAAQRLRSPRHRRIVRHLERQLAVRHSRCAPHGAPLRRCSTSSATLTVPTSCDTSRNGCAFRAAVVFREPHSALPVMVANTSVYSRDPPLVLIELGSPRVLRRLAPRDDCALSAAVIIGKPRSALPVMVASTSCAPAIRRSF